MRALWERQTLTARVEWAVALLATVGGGVAMFHDGNTGLEGPMVLVIVPIFLGFLLLVRVIVFLAALLLRLFLVLLLLVVVLVLAIVQVVVMKVAKRAAGSTTSSWLVTWMPFLWGGMFARFPLVTVTSVLGRQVLAGKLDAALQTEGYGGAAGDVVYADLDRVTFRVSSEREGNVEVAMVAGGIDFGDVETRHPPSRERENGDDEVERAELPLGTSGPSWLQRAPDHVSRIIRAGTRVVLYGGEWSGAEGTRVLSGTAEHPVWAVFG